jgi:hypothetical protein
MFDIPVATPFTSPEIVFIVATPGFDDVQVPPDTELVSVADAPVQSCPEPPIDGGNPIADIDMVLKHPEPRSYVITAVPEEIPVTTPAVLTDNFDASLLVQVPPLIGWVSVMEAPTHRLEAPEMAAKALFTVIERVTKQPAPESV